jgi:hypothetical protein
VIETSRVSEIEEAGRDIPENAITGELTSPRAVGHQPLEV